MLTPEIIVILFTRGLRYVVQCTKNRLTCEIFVQNIHEHRLNCIRFSVFPGVSGVANTLQEQRQQQQQQQLTSRLKD